MPKVKLQASQGYRSDSVRPSTHRASPGLLLFRKARMPSAERVRGSGEALSPLFCLGPALPKEGHSSRHASRNRESEEGNSRQPTYAEHGRASTSQVNSWAAGQEGAGSHVQHGLDSWFGPSSPRCQKGTKKATVQRHMLRTTCHRTHGRDTWAADGWPQGCGNLVPRTCRDASGRRGFAEPGKWFWIFWLDPV